MSLIINHHTIFTGDVSRCQIDNVSDEVAKTVLESAKYALKEDEPVALFPKMDDKARFLMREFPGGGLKCTVFYGESDKPVLAFIIAKEVNKETRKQYKELLEIDMTKQKSMSSMPDAPFCSVALTREAMRYPDLLKWIGDFEACLAVAWISGGKIDKAAAAAVAEAKERLWMWLMTGGDCVVDQKMIDLLGRPYLMEFAKNAERNLASYTDMPTFKSGSAPVLERLEHLRGMVG